MQGRIQQTDRHRATIHGLEDANEVFLLKRQQLLQCGAALHFVGRENHLPHIVDAVAFEEHVLGAA